METHFYGNWYFLEDLGQGSFGSVKLAQNKVTGQLVAVKIVNLGKISDPNTIQREICILKTINNGHPNIIKYLGNKKSSSNHFIFTEYLAGGELISYIDPGMPMKMELSFKFFAQLISAVHYIHSLGITHRDIKLENILLDEDDNIKLIDFGLSTVFRHNSKERLLATKCGSRPYTAPEMFSCDQYHAIPADIWSCGIVLFIFFTGEMPWDVASTDCKAYKEYCRGTFGSNWKGLSSDQKQILKCVLNVVPESRATVNQIKCSAWYQQCQSHYYNICEEDFFSQSVNNNTPSSNNENVNVVKNAKVLAVNEVQPPPACLSQMNPFRVSYAHKANKVENAEFFTQPAALDDFLLTQGLTTIKKNGEGQVNTQQTQTQTQNNDATRKLLNTAKKMTRFYVKESTCKKLIPHFEHVLNTFLVQWNIDVSGSIFVTTLDRNRNSLNFRILMTEIPNSSTVLVVFRREKGDSLEFKKFYKNIRSDLNRVVACLENF